MAQSNRLSSSLHSDDSSLRHITSLLDQTEHCYLEKHRVRRDVIQTWLKGSAVGWQGVLVANDSITSSPPGQKMICFRKEQIEEYNGKKAAVLVDVLIPFHYPNTRPCIALRRPENLRELGQTYAYIPTNANDDEIQHMEIYSSSGGQNLINLDVTEKVRKVVRLQLHSAVQDGHADIVKELVDSGFPCNENDENQMTPLRLAVQSGYAEIAALLLERGGKLWTADTTAASSKRFLSVVVHDFSQPVWQANAWLVKEIVSCTDPRNGLSLLIQSAEQYHCLPVLTMLLEQGEPVVALQADADLSTLSLLLELGADVNSMIKSAYDYAKSCLHHAVRRDTLDAIYTLLAAGADVYQVDPDRKSVLHSVKSKEAALMLLSAGAEVNARDRYGCTALFTTEDTAVLEVLFAQGADVNARNNEGETAISRYTSQFTPRAKSLVSTFLRAGASLETPLATRNRLHFARSGNDIADVLQYPDEVRKALSGTDKDGQTPLHYVLDAKQEVLRLLLPFCSQSVLDHKDRFGQTALHIAVRRFLHESTALLLRAGASVNARGICGNTALHVLIEDHNYDDEETTDDNARFIAFHFLNLLLDAGADPKAQNSAGDTPLHIALRRPRSILTQRLLTTAPLPLREKNNQGQTVLHVAAARATTVFVQHLLDAGAKVNAKDVHGRTPLHAALIFGRNNIDIMKQLLAAGANTALADADGVRPTDFLDNKVIRQYIETKLPKQTTCMATTTVPKKKKKKKTAKEQKARISEPVTSTTTQRWRF